LGGSKNKNEMRNFNPVPFYTAFIRKFHLAKLAAEGHWDDIQKDEQIFGPIPEVIKESLGINPSSNKPLNQSTTQPKVVLWGTGAPMREFLYVDDLADGCMFLMNNYEEFGIINIGTGKDQTIKELAEIIAKVTGFKGNLRFDPSKPDGTPVKRLNVSEINSIGWKAKIGLEQGIRSTYKWYVEDAK